MSGTKPRGGIPVAYFLSDPQANEPTKMVWKMVCYNCGKNFKKKLQRHTFEVKCPRCGGYYTDVV